MERLALVVVLVVVAGLLAGLLRRRRPEPPTQARWRVPTQLDRDDFDGADHPWLVVVFTSATCHSCPGAIAKARVLRSDRVAVQEVPYQSREDLHRRYAIDVVPTVLVVDGEGVVRSSFVGEPTATDLWAAVADARE